MSYTKIPCRNERGERGYFLALTAVSAFVLLGFAGLGVDASYMGWQKRRVQTAADIAATAAYMDLKAGKTLANATIAAKTASSLNGYTDGTNSVTVAVNNPPLSGSYAGTSNYVEVVVTAPTPTYFMRVFGQNSVTLLARSTAAISSQSGCIYALSSSGSRALQINGSGTVLNTYCGAISESSASDAYYMEGSSTANLYSSSTIGVVGNYFLNGGGNTVKNQPANTNTTPTAGITNPGDPLASIPAPTPSGLTLRRGNGNTNCDMNSIGNSGNSSYAACGGGSLQPGIYCGGITIGNTNGITYTMAAGTYVMAGGGLNVQSTGKLDATSGVTIYNTNSSSASWGCTASFAFSPIVLSGQPTYTQKAPVSGGLAGIAMFQDRTLGASTDVNQINGNTSVVIDGALYFKRSNLLFTGSGSSASGYLIMVADTITMNGNAAVQVKNNYSTLPSGISPTGASGSTTLGLVE